MTKADPPQVTVALVKSRIVISLASRCVPAGGCFALSRALDRRMTGTLCAFVLYLTHLLCQAKSLVCRQLILLTITFQYSTNKCKVLAESGSAKTGEVKPFLERCGFRSFSRNKDRSESSHIAHVFDALAGERQRAESVLPATRDGR